MKIAILSSAHPATDTRIFIKQARSLSTAGHDVHLIVPHDMSGVVHGVSIHGLEFPKSRKERMTVTILKVCIEALKLRPDVVHIHDPELIPVALFLKLRGMSVIYDSHEDLPDQILSKEWIPGFLRRPVALAVKGVLRLTIYLDAIIAATPKIASTFPESKTTLIQNFPIPNELAINRINHVTERQNVIAYVGVLTEARGAYQMAKAMEIVRKNVPDAILVIAGNLVPESIEDNLSSFIRSGGIELLGWCDRKQVRELLGSASVGLCLFQPGPNHNESQPNKLFEYMAAGLPVIASNFQTWGTFVNQEVGLLVDPEDPNKIAAAILEILSDPAKSKEMGRCGQILVDQKYNWNTESDKLLHLYRRFEL